MSKTTFTLGAALFLLAAGLFLANLREVMAQCPSSDSVVWSPATAQTSDVNGNFTYNDSFLVWTFREQPFIGAAEIDDAQSENITSVQYTPAYFFPEHCQGAVEIDIAGTISGTSATLVTLGWVWDSGDPPPYAEAYQTLTIN